MDDDQPSSDLLSSDPQQSTTLLGLDFTPVPRQRRRRNGWTEERQRQFIAALAECGSVARAARSVGITPRSAYRLMDAEGADDFARAWDLAIDIGIERVRLAALDRTLHGAPCAVYRRGKLVRVETRFNDRLAIALLSGQDKSVDAYRRTAVSRRAYRQDLAHYDKRNEQERLDAEARIPPEQLAEEQLIRERLEELGQPRPRQPRVRIL
jgi:hypothetical protein